MHILKTDLPSEIGGLLRTLKVDADPARILGRTVHQPYPVRTEEILLNQLIMVICLLRCQQLTNHTSSHRKQSVLNAGLLIRRMHH
ncbi:hypothetical protein D3C85_1468360 [compost metagenome]